VAHTGTPSGAVLDPVAPAPVRLVTLAPADVAVIPSPRSRPSVVPLAVRPPAPARALRTAFVPPVAPPTFMPPFAAGRGVPAGPVRPARPVPARRPTRSAHTTTGRVLLAAVAAGAVVPALQSLDTHVADAGPATATAQVGRVGPTLAAQQAPTRGGRPVAAAVATVSVPVVQPGSDVSAGDTTDMAQLAKAIGVTRENGPLEFGQPYAAGNEKSLDGQIARALGLLGLPQKLAPGVKKIIMRESTGNPDAINNWDSNASAGTPSKGLMQLIDVSFRNAVLPSLANRGIYDPVANITAGVRTMIANHGLDAVLDGGLRNSSGSYIGYGGARLPDDGLGIASRR